MTLWIIEPRDPLIFRDGRPFGPEPGARALSLPFPFPSTVAGAIRTRDGLDAKGKFQPGEIPRLKQIEVRGPLLVELEADTGEIAEWLVPAPADALVLDLDSSDPRKGGLKVLLPLELPAGAGTDLPTELAPVGMPRRDPRKPSSNAPRYWKWPSFEKWLLDPHDQEVNLEDLGHNGPIRETRMHVGIKPETKAADEERGALFQTRGLEFTHVPKGAFAGARRLGLATDTNAPNLKPGIASLGGERRMVFWRRSMKTLPPFPTSLKEKIVAQHHCRLILITPAFFKSGWKPAWLLEPREGVEPILRAVAINRPQVVSGWDFEHNKPKPTRRLAPASTVFFLELKGDATAIEKWAETIWMHCISDEEQDRRDGFGLAVLGVWDGRFHRMEV